ncbi:MAG: ABC transporter substrate-binding protein [Acetobacteraceae bacterium]|nr:ABC transporter substrate-binding protein [Acetobacteraceae bacterium]
MKRRTLLQAAAATAVPTAFAIAQTDRSKTLNFVPQANLTLLDPIFTTALVTVNHGWAVYDTLFGANVKLEVKPQMADGFTVSDDGRTYDLKLREGLKFHNNEPVRAQDCAPSLVRWAARDTIGQTVWKFVENCSAADDRTIRIKLTQKLPIIIDAIAKGGASIPFIMPEHLAKTDPFKQVTDTTGSGPFRFVKEEFVPGSTVVYVKNKDYVPRQEAAEWTAGGKIAHMERIVWTIIPDSATASAALQAGEIDWYEQVQADLVPLLRKNPDIRIGSANPTGFNGVLRFNHLHPPFNNVAVRRAVMMAVNQADYMNAITGADTGAFRLCKAVMPCGTPYGREIGAAAMPGDLDKARAALKASGYNGEKVVIINPTDFVTIGPMGDVTYDLLKKMGMNLEIIQTDWGTVTQRRAMKDPGGWNILHTWAPSNVVADPVQQFFARGLGATGWFGWYEDAETEKHTRDWLLGQTPAEQHAAADAFQRRAFENAPYVPLGQFQIRTAMRKNLVGQIEASGAYMWNIKRV